MKPEIVKRRVGDIKVDYDLWPRRLTRIDSSNLARIREAIRAGEKLPPLVLGCLAGGKQSSVAEVLVDGNHRKTAYTGLFKDEHVVDCELRSYPDKRSMLLDATALNAKGSMPLDSKDKTDVVLRLRELGASTEEVCKALGMTPEGMDRVLKRTATTRGGETVVIPGGARPLQGLTITKKQETLLKRTGGMPITVNVRIVLAQLEAKAMDLEDERVVAELTRLRDVLNKLLPE